MYTDIHSSAFTYLLYSCTDIQEKMMINSILLVYRELKLGQKQYLTEIKHVINIDVQFVISYNKLYPLEPF